MKTPIAYYGGKVLMLDKILPMIPPHIVYVEPFCGGAAVFFAKEPSKYETINDVNGLITNFYWQLKTNFYELQKLIFATLHSEVCMKRAGTILKDENFKDPMLKAWAFWANSSMGWGHSLYKTFFSPKKRNENRITFNRVVSFTKELSNRLRHCEILQKDALNIIKFKDNKNTFFYLDPPYVGANQGHYAGYSEDDFRKLLDALGKIKGKFLLSSYPGAMLNKYRRKYKWKYSDERKLLQCSNMNKNAKKKTKIECLTFNYTLPKHKEVKFIL